jgi:hypothetical protein
MMPNEDYFPISVLLLATTTTSRVAFFTNLRSWLQLWFVRRFVTTTLSKLFYRTLPLPLDTSSIPCITIQLSECFKAASRWPHRRADVPYVYVNRPGRSMIVAYSMTCYGHIIRERRSWQAIIILPQAAPPQRRLEWWSSYYLIEPVNRWWWVHAGEPIRS